MKAEPITRNPAATTLGWTLAPRARRTLLSVHIVSSVGLLGEVSGFLVVAIRAAGTSDPAFASASYDLLATFSAVFGIPLSMVALGSGIFLGLGTKWGVLRHPWVMLKLGLLLSVILVGALVLGPSVDQLRSGAQGLEGRVIAGATWDVLALGAAVVLSVFRPGPARSAATDRRRRATGGRIATGALKRTRQTKK